MVHFSEYHCEPPKSGRGLEAKRKKVEAVKCIAVQTALEGR